MTADDVRSLQLVLAIRDPGERNAAITRTYASLARRMERVVGVVDASWLTFGTWASASAGRFIRGEAVPLPWGSRAVAEGNAAIIADVAPRFSAFLDLAARVPASDLAALLGDEPLLVETDILAEAFDCYALAAATPAADPESDVRHALVMLRGNTLIAHHEQWMADRFVDAALPLGGPFGLFTTLPVTIGTPDGYLRVSRDVPPPPYLAGRQWPAALDDLDDATARLARRYGQDPRSVRHSNATSWEDFEERMGYIFCFFRAYQREPRLRALPPGVPDLPDEAPAAAAQPRT